MTIQMCTAAHGILGHKNSPCRTLDNLLPSFWFQSSGCWGFSCLYSLGIFLRCWFTFISKLNRLYRCCYSTFCFTGFLFCLRLFGTNLYRAGCTTSGFLAAFYFYLPVVFKNETVMLKILILKLFCKVHFSQARRVLRTWKDYWVRLLDGSYRCSKLLETHTLFLTKMCDLPFPISDPIQSWLPYFRPDLSKNITISQAVFKFWLTCSLDLNTCNKLITLWVNCINNDQVHHNNKGPWSMLIAITGCTGCGPYWQLWSHAKNTQNLRLTWTDHCLFQTKMVQNHTLSLCAYLYMYSPIKGIPP